MPCLSYKKCVRISVASAIVESTLHLPAAQRFWRAHPRMRFLPNREVDIGGQMAVVTGFESLGEPARLEVVALRETFEVISINGRVISKPDRLSTDYTDYG
jgi:hypothetical protein